MGRLRAPLLLPNERTAVLAASGLLCYGDGASFGGNGAGERWDEKQGRGSYILALFRCVNQICVNVCPRLLAVAAAAVGCAPDPTVNTLFGLAASRWARARDAGSTFPAALR